MDTLQVAVNVWGEQVGIIRERTKILPSKTHAAWPGCKLWIKNTCNSFHWKATNSWFSFIVYNDRWILKGSVTTRKNSPSVDDQYLPGKTLKKSPQERQNRTRLASCFSFPHLHTPSKLLSKCRPNCVFDCSCMCACTYVCMHVKVGRVVLENLVPIWGWPLALWAPPVCQSQP